MALKAFVVYPAPDPYDEGCILVYANTRNQARMIGYTKGPWVNHDGYLSFRAQRAAWFDKWAEGNKPYFCETNDELPEPFFDDSIV